MKYLHLFVLGFIVFIFNGCTPKIAIKTLNEPILINESTKKMAIVSFENDTIGQTDAIIKELNSIYIDGIKYYTLIDQHSIDTLIQEKKLGNVDSFRVYSGSTQAKAILIGKVLTQNLSIHHFTKEKINYDRCILYEKNKEKKERKCLEYATMYIPCTTQDYDVQTSMQLVNIEDSTILFSKIYNANDSYSFCSDRYYSFPNNNKIFTQLTQKIARNFASDITPTYKYIQISTIDELDISTNENQKILFENSIEAIKNGNIDFALQTFQTLNSQLENKSIAVLYNLGLCNEALGYKENANSLYTLALHKSKVYNELIDQAVKRTADQIFLEEKLQPLLKH